MPVLQPTATSIKSEPTTATTIGSSSSTTTTNSGAATVIPNFGPKNLKVTNTPGKNLVATNYAYVNEHEFPEYPVYVKVRDIILIAQAHASIEYGSIALNKIQRQSAHLPNNADADCELYRVPKQSFELSFVTMGEYFECSTCIIHINIFKKLISLGQILKVNIIIKVLIFRHFTCVNL